MLFDVTTDRLGSWSRVRVVGDVDLGSLPAVRAAFESVAGGSVVVDLTSVGVLDPQALGVLLAATLRTERRGGRFVVACPPGPARDLLVELRLDAVWVVVDAPEDVPDA